jgi:hypothetical protein
MRWDGEENYKKAYIEAFIDEEKGAWYDHMETL